MLFLIGQPFQSLAVIQLHALSLLQKTVQIRDKFFLYMDPELAVLSTIDLFLEGKNCWFWSTEI
jgi:hypothetical protein